MLLYPESRFNYSIIESDARKRLRNLRRCSNSDLRIIRALGSIRREARFELTIIENDSNIRLDSTNQTWSLIIFMCVNIFCVLTHRALRPLTIRSPQSAQCIIQREYAKADLNIPVKISVFSKCPFTLPQAASNESRAKERPFSGSASLPRILRAWHVHDDIRCFLR